MIYIASPRLPLTATEGRKGSTVIVTMTDGSQVRGELLAVKKDSLLIYDEGAGRGENLELPQVAQVNVLKKSRVMRGFAIGLASGFAASVLIPHHHHHDDYGIITHLFLPVTISCLGGIIGNQASIPKSFSLARVSPLAVKARLERLKSFARDQDAGPEGNNP